MRTVLCIDDEQDILNALKRKLRKVADDELRNCMRYTARRTISCNANNFPRYYY